MNQVTQTVPTLHMTKAAAERVRILAEAEGNPDFMLRLSVSGGGCSGFSYGFSLDAEATPDDRVFQFFGARLVVDEVSLDLLKGSEVDFVDDLMAASFRIKNPNATSTCGCGTSFSA
jgi:iron-sulfur cluster insertion protein